METRLRSILARLPLPMLALAAAHGVYSFALLFVPSWVAIVQAAAFELCYIGLAVVLGLEAAQRRRATAISYGAVVVSIAYNTLAGLFHRNPDWLEGLPWGYEWGLALLHGAPLAWVAYLVSDLLLHTPAQVSNEAAQLRAELAQRDEELTQTQVELAQQWARAAHGEGEVAQAYAEAERLRAELAQREQEAAQISVERAQADRRAAQERAARAQLEEELAHLRAAGPLDPVAIARVLREREVSLRDVAALVRVPESTLRSRLAKTNGHVVESGT